MKRSSVVSSAALLALGAGLGLNRIRGRFPDSPVVVITGGSRGLGLAMAMEYARQGARLALCSRDLLELRIAEKKLLPFGAEVFIYPCDIADRDQVRAFIAAVASRFGRIDVLVNNAGVMEVAPFEMVTEEEMRNVFEINLWGVIRTAFEALPHMPEGSRLVTITSIGAAVAVPHLLPYTVSKFGALGFSLGMDAELAPRKISVTTVLPGLMRTGSFVNALFKGDREKEFGWFSLGGALPFTSISAESAARQIVRASKRRQRFIVLSPQAKILRLIYQNFPNASLALFEAVNRLLPAAKGRAEEQRPEPGRMHRGPLKHGGITRMGDQAGDKLNENMVG